MVDNIFLQVSTLLAITVSIAFVMRVLRQPLIVAYLVAGILSGPVFLNLLHGAEATYEALAQFGVVLLLFVVGLSLNFEHIRRIGRVSLLTGLSQVLFTSAVGYGLLRWLGQPLVSSLYLAVAITFSSTIIIVKLLSDKKETETTYGRYTLGLMIVQDIIAVLIMLVLATVNGTDGSLFENGTLFILKVLSLIALVSILSRSVLPRLLRKAAYTGEFLFIFTVAWCFGVASLLHLLGFSLEIGAIVAGITLGSSPYQSTISSRVKPLRDFFIVLFFIILGSQMTLKDVSIVWVPATILSVFILLGNPFILYHSFRLLKFTRRNSFFAGTTAAQVSEFGFVLLLMGVELGHIGGVEVQIFTMVALITIVMSSYMVTYNKQLYQLFLPVLRVFGEDRHLQKEERKKERYDVMVFGYHRIGWKVCEELKKEGVAFAVVDFNPDAIARLQDRQISCFFGDASDVEFLETLPLESAKLVISTIPDADDQIALIEYVKGAHKKTKFVGTLYHNHTLDQHYRVGADYIVLPHLLGGRWVSEMLGKKQWTKESFARLRKEQKEELRLRYTANVLE